MRLTGPDKDSPAWRAVKAYTEARIVELQVRNSCPGLPMIDTEQIRGGIRELKKLLELEKPARGVFAAGEPETGDGTTAP